MVNKKGSVKKLSPKKVTKNVSASPKKATNSEVQKRLQKIVWLWVFRNQQVRTGMI